MSVKIISKYIGDSRIEIEHGPSRSTIVTDLPVDNGGKGRMFSPTDLIPASLSSCVLTIMSKMAEKNGLDIKGCSIEIEKHMQENPRRISRLAGAVTFPSHLSELHRKKLLACVKTCPVHKSLHPDIEIEIKEI
ncbi:MAG: OsmC family protein [Elusimicrobia bacterium]|nr:OsmC family protein [Elusimicrobiota bacterium]